MVAMKNFRVAESDTLFPWINKLSPKVESVSDESASIVSQILDISWAVSLDEAIVKIKEMTDGYNSSLKKIEDEEKESKKIELQKQEEELKIAEIFSNLEDETYNLDLASIPENKDEVNNWTLKIVRTKEENKLDKYDWLFEDAA